MAHDVFISHSHKDKAIADAVCAMLESNGIRCWIAPRDIEPGVDWPTAISTALAGSRVFVLIFSGNANKSEDVGRELILAANNNLVIVPFKIGNVTPEPGKLYYLARTHWLDAMNPPTREQIQNLVKAVQAFLPKRRKPKLVLTPKEFNRSAALEEGKENQQHLHREEAEKDPVKAPLDEGKPEGQAPGGTMLETKVENVEPDQAGENRSLLTGLKINSKKLWIGGSAIVLLAALVIVGILWFGSTEKPFNLQSFAIALPIKTVTASPTVKMMSSPTPKITVSPGPTITAKPTNTVKPTSTKTPQPTPTRPPWVSEFAEPILSLIEKHPPNLTDDFSSGQVSWLTGVPGVPVVGDFEDVQLILRADEFAFTTFYYSNLVMEFDWKCYPCEWDWSTKGGETKIRFSSTYITDVSTNAPRREYNFSPSSPMNHTLIIVKDESVAVIINEEPVYYGNYLTAIWEPGQVVFIPSSDVILDNFKVWNLDKLLD
jgi:hypothetical protein